ncbi:MAG: hypothetical protein H7Z37_12330 [Pyrinomonadaceae bacterium]|nr:hypothetical protein [Pyrinomonadaceae bacterium]
MSVHRFRQRENTPATFLEKESEPPKLSDRAFDNLRFIRETMERSTAFTAVSGYGGALMGATAIGAAIIASQQTSTKYWLITWLAEAVLALAIGVLAMWQKAKIIDAKLFSTPTRKFALGFAPPIFAGIALTIVFYKHNLNDLLPTVWLLIYGAAVMTGGMFSVKPIPIMGAMILSLGVISAISPPEYGNILMALGFGVLQIIFGVIIGRKFGG